MARALLKGVVIAESEHVQIIEGNIYFPPDAVKKEFLKPSGTRSICPWKGIASYYDIEVEGEVIKDGAWYYHDPKEAARSFGDYVAFWRGVAIEE